MLKEKIVKICDQLIEYGLLAIVFFIPLIFDFTISSYNLIDLYKIVFFRVMLSLILLAYITKVFLENKLSLRGDNKIFWLAAGLGLSFFISSLFSLEPNQSFWGSFFRQQGFYNFFHYLLFFVLLILNIREFKQVKRLIIAVIASASLVSLYGLAQYFSLDPFYWTESYLTTGRIFSTLGQPNFFGHYLILVLPFGVYAYLFMARRFWAKFFVGLAILMQLACLTFTYSRAAWLGFLGAMTFLLLAWLISERRKKLALGLITLLVIGLAMIIGLKVIKPANQNPLYDVNLINRLKSIVDFSGGSSKMRLYYLESAVQEIKQASFGRLLIGFGPETLASVFIKHYRQDWGVYEAIDTLPDRAHNWLFDQILALGFLGLIATLAFYVYFIYRVAEFLRAKPRLESDGWLLIFLSASLVGYFINNFFSFSLFTVLVYLYLILALGWFIINHRAETKIINIRLTVFSKLLIWLSLLTVLTIFVYTNNLNQVRAEKHYVKALKAVKLSACSEVMGQMEKAISLSPNTDYYRVNYIFLMLNCFSSIKDRAVQEQLRDNLLEQIQSIGQRGTYEILNNTARAYTLFGFYLDKTYYARAEQILNGLIADFPYLTTAYEDLGKQKVMQEDYPGAIAVYRRALRILPSLDDPNLNVPHRAQIASIAVRLDESLGQAYFKIKNYDLALNSFEKGLKLEPYRATLYKNIADIYFVKNQLAQAIIWNQRGLMLNPTDFHWPLALSLLYRDKKDLSRAREYLNQALELAPENQDLKNYYKELNK